MDSDEQEHAQIQALLRSIAAEHDTTVAQLVGPARTTHITRARHHAMAVLRWSTGLSYPAIADVFRRDHTTVMAGIAKYEESINAYE